MTKYLLSTHTVEDQTREPRTEEERQELGRRLGTIEREMKSSGAWGFSGRLHEPDTATVVRVADGELLTTDGPFAESKEHLAGFYVIEHALRARPVALSAVRHDDRTARGLEQQPIPAHRASATGLSASSQELARSELFGPAETETSRTGDRTVLTVPIQGDPVGEQAVEAIRELRGDRIGTCPPRGRRTETTAAAAGPRTGLVSSGVDQRLSAAHGCSPGATTPVSASSRPTQPAPRHE